MRRSVTLLVIGFVLVQAPLVCADAPFQKNGRLVTVVPGADDDANDQWTGIAATVSPTRDRWIIQQEGVKTSPRLAHTDPSHIITIGTNESSESVRNRIADILKERNATVTVDMDLTLPASLRQRTWQKPTNWAAGIVNILAEAYTDKNPKARTVLIAQSAGTEAVAESSNVKLGSDRPLYDQLYLMSPRRVESVEYPKNSVLVFADGDFYANPRGIPSGKTVLRTYGEQEAIEWQQQGYKVIRIVGDDRPYHAMAVAGGSIVLTLWEEYESRRQSHRESTEVENRPKMLFYEPGQAKPVDLPNTSLGQALNAVSSWPESYTATKLEELRAEEPTPGIGGISLNATAWMPIDPVDVDFAGYFPKESALYLQMRSGHTIRFPSLDSEVLRQSYEIAYVIGKKAELSIGLSHATNPDGAQVSNLQAPGNFSVYYFGRTQDTLLGLVMYNADARLATLAFGSTAEVRSLSEHVSGFRSMPELFPEKYTNNPANDRYIGAQRIFINPSLVELILSDKGDNLQFGQTAFSVRFGDTGPAEAAYAAFLQAGFDQIAKTDLGAPLAQLIPYAKAMAIFHWLRENNVRVDARELLKVISGKVFTPTSTPVTKEPTLEDITPRRPTVFFGPFGPTRIVRADGSETTIRYRNGLVSDVTRYDKAVLHVYRDGLDSPIGFQWGANHAAAFLQDPNLGLVLAKEVDVNSANGAMKVQFREDTLLSLVANPENLVASFAIQFALGQI